MQFMGNVSGTSGTSQRVVVQEYSNVTFAATGDWGGATATIQFSPDYPNVQFVDVAQSGADVTMTATHNIQNVECGGGMWFRISVAGGTNADLDFWVSGDGVFPER